MIKKTVLQGVFIVLSFLLVWFAFSQLDFMKFFKVEERTTNVENRLGDLIWDEIARTDKVIINDSIIKTLDKLLKPICDKNNIDRDSLKVHIVQKDEINAFALPNNHLVVYTGLITDCKKQEALQGVLGHEIAHIENHHVMKKLSQEIGYSVLLASAAGSNGARMAREILKALSSSAYDRSLEKEADIESVKYLIKANIDPKPMADFMYQMAQEKRINKNMYWIADHPESEERAKYILDFIKGKKLKSKPTLSENEWKIFQKQVKDE